MTQSTDCLVVGAGPAGLAASAALAGRGVDHVVLERGRAGQTWRTQRWDSLRLNNPGWMNPMLGEQTRNTYLSAGEVVTRLAHLASLAPVQEHTPVVGLRRRADAWTVRTADAELRARTVVVATGGENVPLIPRWLVSSPTASPSSTLRPTAHRTNCRTAPCWLLAAPNLATRSPRSCSALVDACTLRPVLSAAPRPDTAVGKPWNGWSSADSSTSAQISSPIGP
jgi:glycine/D-amino acid oxidase-like deaminating enzyme